MHPVEFHREEHRYVVPPGREVPSVTTILGAVGAYAGEHFKTFFDYSFLSDARAYSAMDRGTWLHDLVAMRLRSGPLRLSFTARLAAEYPEWWRYYPSFERWMAIAGAALVPILLETPLYSPVHDFAGTPDIVALYDGEPSVIDIKTAAMGEANPDTAYQSAGYELLLRDQEDYPYHGKLHRRYALVLTPDSETAVIELRPGVDYYHVPESGSVARLSPYPHSAHDRAVFLAARQIYGVIVEDRR